MDSQKYLQGSLRCLRHVHGHRTTSMKGNTTLKRLIRTVTLERHCQYCSFRLKLETDEGMHFTL